MRRLFEDREVRRQGRVIAILTAVICVVLIIQFTRRTPDAAERERARVMLRRIYDLEQAHFAEVGTYLPIDREKNGALLLLNNAPGKFHYRVTATTNDFTGIAEADLNGDGRPEVWQVQATIPEPVLLQED